jgi:SAM-dependent methyltransferase
MQPHESNEAQAQFWEGAGPVWQQMQERLDAQANDHGLRAIDALAPADGATVIDIGCGAGTSSFQLADRVGPAGTVVGYDISSTMVDAARARAEALGVTNVRFVVADAHTETFEPDADGVFSRFGVMFFGDPVGAFANIRTGLRPGGRLSFACWQSPANNPWISGPLGAVAKHIELPFGPDPTAPGPFAFADPDRVRNLLDAAGFRDIQVEGYEKAVDMGATMDDAVGFVLGLNPLTASLRANDPELADKVFADVADSLRAYETDRGVETPSATWIVTADA